MKSIVQLLLCIIFLSLNTNLSAQPGNDDCSDALPILQLDGTCIEYDFDMPTFDLINGSCTPSTATNVWFTFTAIGVNATFNITDDPKLNITIVEMPTPCSLAGATEIACGASPFIVNNLDIGTTYTVIISNGGYSGTDFEMCVTNPPPPPNDEPCSATPVSMNGCVTGTTLGAGIDFTIPNCPNNNVQNAIFFSYVLGPNTGQLDIDITNMGITGQMGAALLVFPNGCSSNPTLAGNQTYYCGAATNELSFDGLTPGSTVYLMIGSTTAGAGIISDMCFTEVLGDPPCAANVDCPSAEVIVIPTAAEPVCVTGCNVGMPPGGFTNCGNAFLNPTAWYTFNTGPNNTAVFNLSSPDFTSPSFVLMTNCNTILECNPLTSTLQPNTNYIIGITDAEGNTGSFEMCITLLSIVAPCIREETFTITGASMGSPLEGPFKPCEVISFQYSTNFLAGGGCQWIHSFVPYFSDCWQNALPQILPPYPAGSDASNLAWYPAGTTEWKPTTNNPPSATGITANGKLCLIGTAGCMPFVGGGQCGNPGGGTPMPAGWVSTVQSGTCGSNAPNLSWGIQQGCNSSSVKVLSFNIQIPCNACSCDNEEGFVIGMASFPDGATGGYNNPQCNGNGLLKRNILVECCTPPEMIIVDGQTCSDVTYFGDITLDPSNSTLEWTVVTTNGVLGATSGSGGTFSQTLKNLSNSPKIVTYSIIPISPTGCRGEAQLLHVTVLPAIIVNAGPDKTSCPGATVTIGNNPIATGGAGAPYTIIWSNGESTNTIVVSPTLTTIYTVTVTDASGCEAIDQVTVTVSGALEVNITPDPAVFCFSDRFNHSLTANVNGTNTPFTYTWVTPWGSPTSQTVSILAPYEGTFQILVEVVDAIGCIGIGVLDLTLHPDPLVLILDKPTVPLCPTEEWQISSSPLYLDGTVFSSVPPGLITFDGRIQTSLMTPGVDYWFYATYTDPNTGCSNKDSFQTKTILLVDPVITPVGPFCVNNTSNIQLSATPAAGTWSGPVTAGGVFVPSTAGAGTHVITYAIGTGNCTKDTTIEITVNPLPAPLISGLMPFCKSLSPNPVLTASIPGGTWSAPILSDGTVPIDVLAPGTYPFTYTVTVDGCEGTTSGSLVISPQPDANINPEAIVCNQDPFNKGKSKIDLDNAVLSGATNGVWTELAPPSGAADLGGNEYDFLGVPTGTIATFVYTLTATAPCVTFTDTIRIEVDEECDCPKLEFNPADPLCTDAAVLDLNSLKIKAGLGNWTLVGVPSGSNPGTLTGSNFDGTDADPGTYTVQYTLNPPPTEPECPTDIQLQIIVNPAVIYALTPEIKLCNNVPKPPSTKTMVNLDNLFIGQSVVGTWTNDDNIGVNTSGNTWDVTGVGVGTYQFTFTPTGAIAPCLNVPTTIDVVVTNECDCPNLSVLIPSTAICSNDLAMIDLDSKINSAVAGAWTLIQDPDGPKSTIVAGGNFDPTGKKVGTYTFRFEIGITPPEDCDSTVEVDVVISPELVYQLQPDAVVCNIDPKNENDNQLNFAGPSIWISAVIPGTWTDTDNSGALQSGNIWTFNGVPTGVYTFTFTPSGAQAPCPNTPQTIEITVVDNCACDDLPAIPGVAAACNNASTVTLVAPAGTSGTWSFKSVPAGANPATIAGNVLDILDKDQGNYVIRFNFNNIAAGCPDSGFVTFVLSDYKSAGTSGPDLTYCEKTVQIIDLLDEITGEEAGGVWSEVGPNTAGAALSGTILRIQDLGPGNYIFEYRQLANGACPANSSEVNVTINANPIADAGSTFELTCEVAEAQIGGSGSSSGSNISYSWTEKNNNPIPNPKDLVNTVKLEGTYYLTVTNTLTGCMSIDSVVITSDPDRPQGIVIERDGPTCFGFRDGYIRVTDITGGVPPILYSLNGGPFSSTKSWSNLSGSNNTLQIKDANGCLLILDNIILIEPTLVTVEMGNDTLIELGDTVLIDPEISIPEDSISSILFSSDFDFINCTGCFDITVFPNQTTEYTVEVKDNNGCSDTDSKRIVVKKGVNIFIPNIFTPNGDGNNDKVFISTNDREIKTINSFQIYDRWGEKMYEALNFQPNDPSQGWDGNLKGQKCNPAVYVYWTEIELFDGTRQIIKGDVTLMR